MATIGIDFGTTKTIAAWVDGDGLPHPIRLGSGRDDLPTTLHVDKAGRIVIGEEADERRAHDWAGYKRRIKRDLGKADRHVLNGHSFTCEQLVAHFLREVVQRAETEAVHARVEHVVVTVPADYGPAKRKALEEAIRAAGIPSYELLDEPVAAALAWLHLKEELATRVMVFDWGGGTLDIATLEKQEDGEFLTHPSLISGDAQSGGEDIDDLLIQGIDQMLAEAGRPTFQDRPDAEKDLILKRVREAKIQHSRKPVVTWSLPLADMTEPYRWDWTRAQFDTWVEPAVGPAVALALRQFEAAQRLGIAVAQVILIGGSSRLPLVRERLQSALGIEPLRWDLAMEAVAYGAAIRAGAWRKPAVVAPPPLRAAEAPTPAPKSPAPTASSQTPPPPKAGPPPLTNAAPENTTSVEAAPRKSPPALERATQASSSNRIGVDPGGKLQDAPPLPQEEAPPHSAPVSTSDTPPVKSSGKTFHPVVGVILIALIIVVGIAFFWTIVGAYVAFMMVGAVYDDTDWS